jgi:hypothetical protein
MRGNEMWKALKSLKFLVETLMSTVSISEGQAIIIMSFDGI